MLQDLSDPKSSLHKQLKELVDAGHPLDELPIGKTLPALKDTKLPEGLVSVNDLVKALKSFPVRREAGPSRKDEPGEEKTREEPKKEVISTPKPPRPTPSHLLRPLGGGGRTAAASLHCSECRRGLSRRGPS